MIAVIASFRVKTEGVETFENLYSSLMAQVKSNEPNTQLYQLCRSKTDAGLYRVIFTKVRRILTGI